MASKRFDSQINMLCTSDERAMLQDIATEEGSTASDVVRRFIRIRHAQLFGRPEPKTTPRGGRRRKR